MNRKRQQQINEAYERVKEIRKKIHKTQTQQPRFPWQLMFLYNLCMNLDFTQFPKSIPPNLKIVKPRKPKHWFDEIPILVGIDEITQQGTCAICLQDLNEKDLIKILNCNHYFHNECIKEWFIIKTECPTCRNKIQEN